MRNLILAILVMLTACQQKKTEPDFYKNLYTGEVLNKKDFEDFRTNFVLELHEEYKDSLETPQITWNYFEINTRSDSVIQNFKYTIKVGYRYLVNASNARIFEYLNKEFPSKKVVSLKGDTIQIGGQQDKPTLINFWFIHCPPCVAEMPVLNELQEKYGDKVNFVSITFQKKNEVVKFLKKHEYNFVHIVDAKDFVDEIGIKSYPKNVFLNKRGVLKIIEGGIPFNGKGEIMNSEEFESYINKLL